MPASRDRKWLAAALCLFLLVLAAPWWEEHLITSIDGGWMTALTDAGARGEIVGRDLHATYGWAFQQVGVWARALHRQHSSIDSVVLLSVLLWILGAVLLVAALLLIGPTDVGGMLLTCLVAAMASRVQCTWVRPASLVLIAALTSRALREPRLGRLAARLAVLGAAGASLQLLAYDTGIFGLATVAGGALFVVVLDTARSPLERIRRGLALAAAATGGGVAATLAICAAQARDDEPWFHAARIALDLIRGYNPTHAIAWSAGHAVTLALVALMVATGILGWLELRRSPETRGELIPLALAALASLRAAAIRSDVEHIGLSFVPLLVLFCRLAVRAVSGWSRASAAALLVVVVLLAQWNRLPGVLQASFFPLALPQRWQQLRTLDLARHDIAFPASLRAGDPTADLYVFPHSNQLGLVAGRRLALTFVQSYQATSTRLDAFAAHRLTIGDRPLEALVAEDGALDEVQAMTRNPALFETLWRRFALLDADRDHPPLIDSNAGHQVLLRRTPAARDWPSAPIFRRAPGEGERAVLVLPAPVACSLLRIQFEFEYPWTADLGRKAPWRVAVRDGERTLVEARVVALDPRRFSTLVDLLPTSETPAIFRGNAPRRSFDRLEISSADRSLFAVQPRFVAIETVDCINP